MKIALLCGGPSAERGISLNSARSVLDHLQGEGREIVPIYFDHKKTPYLLSPSQLYSNTPSDFDFKLQQTAKQLTRSALLKILKNAAITFPVIHGAFGEDGEIQRFLERHKIPFIGSPSQSCKRAFDKYEANEYIKQNGFFTLPSALLKIYHRDHKKILARFFREHKIKRAIVKPASGGSSIGVFSVSTVPEALEKVRHIFSKRIDTRVVVEPFCEGIEFTTIILQNRFGQPVAVLPTEIEANYTQHQIFDYRKKYLPTNQVKYHCPPRFRNEDIERIQVQAEQLFTLLGMRDFARFDGWLMPNGEIWFSDFNPVSGMEQNSFLFQQSARIGFSHRDILRFVLKRTCQRHGIPLPEEKKTKKRCKPVAVLFGGSTSERQVSVMSGTNAWLKLRTSEKYAPEPFLLDLQHNVWRLPYALTLNHTVEEISENCRNAPKAHERLHFLEQKVRWRLALETGEANEEFFLPEKMTLETFIKNQKFIFLGLHGGIGENGTLQKLLQKNGVKYNGPDATCSGLCMDKWATGKALEGLGKEGISVAKKERQKLSDFKNWNTQKFSDFWRELQKRLEARTVIVKPLDEGCSSGIVRLYSASDLEKYIDILSRKVPVITPHTLSKQPGIIEMPLEKVENLLFEPFIETDAIRIIGNTLRHKQKTGWIEVTVGVLEEKGKLRALNPSLTVASNAVLSVEEKFQGGTGINLTPPPPQIVKSKVLSKAKKAIERTTERLGSRGYSRIDAFLNIDNGDIIVIEANTLPALTPSTVLFHQGLAEKPALFPSELIELLIKNKGY